MDKKETVDVVYVGKKSFKRDNVAGTGTIWAGAGDVQAVPATAVGRLMRHPDVWALHDPDAPVEAAPTDRFQAEGSEADEEDNETPADRRPGLTEQVVKQAEAVVEGEKPTETPESEGPKTPVHNKVPPLEHLILAMPNDDEHFTKQGKPRVDKVRELAGNEELTTDAIKAAYENVKGELEAK